MRQNPCSLFFRLFPQPTIPTNQGILLACFVLTHMLPRKIPRRLSNLGLFLGCMYGQNILKRSLLVCRDSSLLQAVISRRPQTPMARGDVNWGALALTTNGASDFTEALASSRLTVAWNRLYVDKSERLDVNKKNTNQKQKIEKKRKKIGKKKMKQRRKEKDELEFVIYFKSRFLPNKF